MPSNRRRKGPIFDICKYIVKNVCKTAQNVTEMQIRRDLFPQNGRKIAAGLMPRAQDKEETRTPKVRAQDTR
jgi:hypothetical protein